MEKWYGNLSTLMEYHEELVRVNILMEYHEQSVMMDSLMESHEERMGKTTDESLSSGHCESVVTRFISMSSMSA